MIINRTTTRTITEYHFDIIDRETGTIEKAHILFQDGKFHRCVVPFHTDYTRYYTREQWRILARLEQEITAIEADQ